MNIEITFLLILIGRFADGYSHRQPSTVSSTGWGPIEVSPNAFLSLLYQNFRVPIYKKQNVDLNGTEYYYAPALILDPTSAKAARNPFFNQYEATFDVIMYDAAFEKAVQQGLTERLGEQVSLHRIRMLPIEYIRIDMMHRKWNANYEIQNQWTPYGYHQSRFSFRVTCPDLATCVALSKDIADYPKVFVAGLEVSFSLQTQRSRRRQIKVKVEHALSAPLYARLTQEFPHTDTVYMTSTELKKMTMEIASNVLASEIVDDDYVVGADQTLSVADFLSSLLQVKSTASDAFTAEMWKSVFWNEDSARPDVITQELNEVYGKSDLKSQEAIRTALNTSVSRMTDTASDSLSKGDLRRTANSTSANEADFRTNSTSGSGFGINVGVQELGGFGFGWSTNSAGAASNSTSSSASNAATAFGSSHEAGSQSALDARKISYDTADGRERWQTLMKEARSVAQWDGRKFVPKAMKLSRINLSMFRSQTTGIATQVSVIRTTSELSSSLNVLDAMPAQPATEFCIGLTCLTVEDFQRVRDLHTGKVNHITVATDGKFCFGTICLTGQDLKRLLLQPTQVTIQDYGKICLGDVCVQKQDFQRLLEVPSRLETEKITGGQFCIGALCLKADDFQRLINLPSRIETKTIAAPDDGQYCLGTSCMLAGDLRRLLSIPDEISTGKIVAVPGGQICAGRVCLTAEDFQRLLDLRHRLAVAELVADQVCFGTLCLTKDGVQRLLDFPAKVAVNISGLSASQICVGSTCLRSVDFQRVLDLPSNLSTQAIVIGDRWKIHDQYVPVTTYKDDHYPAITNVAANSDSLTYLIIKHRYKPSGYPYGSGWKWEERLPYYIVE